MGGGFYDLNILVDRSKPDQLKDISETLKTAFKLGYDTVALNTVVGTDALETQKGKKKKEDQAVQILPPLHISAKDVFGKETETFGSRKFTILNRLTVVLSDAAQTHKLQTCPEVALYDILALQPENDKAFQVCCSSLNCDIITFPMDTNNMPVYIKIEQVGVALEKGVFFEISYSPALRNPNSRRHTIKNAIKVVTYCKRKNLLVTSKAIKPFDLRGPYDVGNLCQLFDIKSNQALDVISTAGRQVLLKAECRKSEKGVFTVMPTSCLPEKDVWKIRSCQNGRKLGAKRSLTVETDEQTSNKPKKKRIK